MYRSSFKPFSSSPTVIKRTILLTAAISLFCLFFNYLFSQVFHIPSPQKLLSLSTWGIHHGLLWQFISYLFVPQIGSGVYFNTLFYALLNLYFIYWIGSSIVETRSKGHFIGLYFGGGLFVGIATYFLLLLYSFPFFFSGASHSIYILLIAWSFLFPTQTVMLFFLFPVPAKWVSFGFIGLQLLLDFSNGNFLSFCTGAVASLYGYLYPILVWEISSPFPRLHSMEKKIIYLKRKVSYSIRLNRRATHVRGNIYSLKPGGDIAEESDFIDKCLDKISCQGKSSLTLGERWKLWRISRKKKKS